MWLVVTILKSTSLVSLLLLVISNFIIPSTMLAEILLEKKEIQDGFILNSQLKVSLKQWAWIWSAKQNNGWFIITNFQYVLTTFQFLVGENMGWVFFKFTCCFVGRWIPLDSPHWDFFSFVILLTGPWFCLLSFSLLWPDSGQKQFHYLTHFSVFLRHWPGNSYDLVRSLMIYRRSLKISSKVLLVIRSRKFGPMMLPILFPKLEMELYHVFFKPHNNSKELLLLFFPFFPQINGWGIQKKLAHNHIDSRHWSQNWNPLLFYSSLFP